jgi:hypothetical protein
MLAFRSEAHVEGWCRQRSVAKGAVFSFDQLWDLARTWYSDRLSPRWTRATAAEAQRVFDGLGLSGPFWRLQ